MSDNSLVLRSINQLMDNSFYIPSYQRGYRWTKKQVEDLLEDVWSFAIDRPVAVEGKMRPFYCLQPIVVRQKNGSDKEWEVIDGQQRLTTIYLILENLKLNIEKDNKNLKRLFYETRENTESYLQDVDAEKANDNIDFYHIYHANETIKNWFKDKANTTDYAAPKGTFATTFLTDTKVIWYEINDDSDTYDIFTRLNIGKIELSNSELIKALFLKRWNSSEAIDTLRLKQLKIATEWDNIENRLQDDSFWYFIYKDSEKKKNKYPNRIEYIFDLMKYKPDDEDDKFTFYKFNDDFEESRKKNKFRIPDTDSLWLEVKDYFLRFEEWYNDRELYHLIGFLIEDGCDISEILKPTLGGKDLNIFTKIAFKEYLKNKIKERLYFNIDNLDYGKSNDKDKIKKVLLLFNIQTILDNEKSNMRFPFYLYKIEDWDLEHVRSVTDKQLRGNEAKLWAKDILEYFSGINDEEGQKEYVELTRETDSKTFRVISIKEGRELLLSLYEIAYSGEVDPTKVDTAYKKISEEFREDNEPSVNDISNLALLDSATNQSYKNAFFPIKRKIILQNDKQGTFIPICTKNVFMKAYSNKLDEVMYWSKDDAQSYFKAITETLKEYLPKKQENDDNK